jgi:hypothetical protein
MNGWTKVLLLQVWSLGQQRCIALKLVRNAEAQPRPQSWDLPSCWMASCPFPAEVFRVALANPHSCG